MHDAMTELRRTIRVTAEGNDGVVGSAGDDAVTEPPEIPERDESSWIQTFSGKKFYPLNPLPQEICIEDIAHGLANTCRFAGQCNVNYSVAQHSLLVSHRVPPEHALWGLLHDASEAYHGDLARPIKNHLPGYRQMQDRLMAAIAQRFGLTLPMPPEVKIADNRMLVTERRDLMGRLWKPIPDPSLDQYIPYRETVMPVKPQVAEERFLFRFQELMANRSAAPDLTSEKAYYDERLKEIPPDVLTRAVDVIRQKVRKDDQERIRADFGRFGEHDWIHQGGMGHHGGGMWIRNRLREEGLTDDLLPGNNWDDYYVQVIEVALGLRPEGIRNPPDSLEPNSRQ